MQDKDVEFLNIGSDENIALAVGKERGPGNAHHAYAVLTQDGDKTLLTVDFQNGPIQENGVNGVQNEQLLGIVIDRLVGFQAGEYACPENQKALELIMKAYGTLVLRTEVRRARGVEGKSVK
jgi:hypothetical protein